MQPRMLKCYLLLYVKRLMAVPKKYYIWHSLTK